MLSQVKVTGLNTSGAAILDHDIHHFIRFVACLQINIHGTLSNRKNEKITQQNNLLEPPFFIDTPSIPNSYMICELMLKLFFKIMEVNGIQ